MRNAPLFFRILIVDFFETALGLVFALNIVFPYTVSSAKFQGVVIVSAIIAAAVSAGRRAVPGFLSWMREKLELTISITK